MSLNIYQMRVKIEEVCPSNVQISDNAKFHIIVIFEYYFRIEKYDV